MSTRIAILGSGAMATACATLLCENPDQEVVIWARTPDTAETLQRDRENKRLLPGVRFPSRLRVTSDVSEATADAAFALKPGTVSGPVAGRFGTVLVRVGKIEPEQVRAFEDLAPRSNATSRSSVPNNRSSIRATRSKMSAAQTSRSGKSRRS